jgi:hypothetical protein
VASDTLTSAASILYEMRADLEAIYPRDNVLLAEATGYNATTGEIGDGAQRITPLDNREIFSGSQVRIPVDFAQLQGGGWVSETGTVNVPIADSITQATINLKRLVVPASITLDLQEDSMSNSSVQYLARKMEKVKDALAMLVDEAMNGPGTGLLATVSGAGGSPGLTIPVAAGTDFDKLLPGTVVDVLTRSNGADPGQGLRRKIASFSESGLTVTFSTTQQASDGGSGSITFSGNEGLYTPGSYGNVMAGGLGAADLTSGTFQAIDRSNFPGWKAVDGRAGTTTTTPLSDPMMDAGVLLGQRAGTYKWDYGYGDPSAINVYKNSKASLVRYNVPTGTLKSGFQGVEYDAAGQPIALVPGRKSDVGVVRFLRKDASTLYGRRKGPDFEDSTGTMFQRFSQVAADRVLDGRPARVGLAQPRVDRSLREPVHLLSPLLLGGLAGWAGWCTRGMAVSSSPSTVRTRPRSATP